VQRLADTMDAVIKAQVDHLSESRILQQRDSNGAVEQSVVARPDRVTINIK